MIYYLSWGNRFTPICGVVRVSHRFSVVFVCFVCLRPVSCVPNAASISEFSVLPVSLSSRCCQYLWVPGVASISEFLVLPVSLSYWCCQYLWVPGVAIISEFPVLPVSLSSRCYQYLWVPGVASISEFPVLPVSLSYPFWIALSIIEIRELIQTVH
jgi:hypothetical protein